VLIELGDSQWAGAACIAAHMSEVVKIKACAGVDFEAVSNVHAARLLHQFRVLRDGQKASCLKGV